MSNEEDEDVRIKNVIKEKISADCSCTVCIEQIENDDAVVLTECQHLFHGVCLDEWINNPERKSELVCPNCNQKFDYYHCCCLTGTEKVLKVEIDESQRMAKKSIGNDDDEEEMDEDSDSELNDFVRIMMNRFIVAYNSSTHNTSNHGEIPRSEIFRQSIISYNNDNDSQAMMAEEENEEDDSLSPLQQCLHNISTMRVANFTLLSKLFTSREYNLSIYDTRSLHHTLVEKNSLMENIFIEFVKTNSAVDLVMKLMCYNNAIELLDFGMTQYFLVNKKTLNIENFESAFQFLIRYFIEFLTLELANLEYCNSMVFFNVIKKNIDNLFLQFLERFGIMPESLTTLFPRQHYADRHAPFSASYYQSRFIFEKKLNVMDSDFIPFDMMLVVTSRIFNLFMDIAIFDSISFDYLDHLSYLLKQLKLLRLRHIMESNDGSDSGEMEEVD